MSSPAVVIFDLGEVLATPSGLFQAFAERVGRDPVAIEAAYWSHRDDYDRGGGASDFWTAVLTDVGLGTEAPGFGELLEELTQIDTTEWVTIRPDATDLLTRLHEVPVVLGILSNATGEMARAARRTSWAPCVSHWFFSSELGMAKPDPALYRHVTQSLDVPADSITFIDDRLVNVDAARAEGWNAQLWTSGAATTAYFEEIGLIPTR